MDDPSFHTTGIPRLYDKYVQAMAPVNNPDIDAALAALHEIEARCFQARNLIFEMRVQRRIKELTK